MGIYTNELQTLNIMNFQGQQATRTYKQINNAKPDTVFPLLCPVREKEWLDGWDYTMIFSSSGVIEKGCVFSTPHHGKEQTIWYVTEHDRKNHLIEFVRVTPSEEVVRINISLAGNMDGTTTSTIAYQYTALSPAKNYWIQNNLDEEFLESMIWWEKAINYFLEKGEKLME